MKSAMFSALLLLVAACFPAQSPNLGNTQVFPPDNAWNWDISGYQVHPNSANFIASIGTTVNLHPDFGTAYGIPYITVNASQPKIPINFVAYGSESDPGPYPIPLNAPIEGGGGSSGDRHVLAVDTSNRMLYELYAAVPQAAQWNADCGAVFDLKSNQMRPAGWTSADAAGLPVFPGLVRYEEVYIKKVINHAVRFTVVNSQKAYIYPARHYASSSTDPNRPPMGLRVRLKASFNISTFSQPVQVILTALKKYGMLMADNGSNWYITGAPDDRWNDDSLGQLKSIAGSNFEAVLTVDNSGNPIFPIATEHSPKVSTAPVFTVHPNPFNSESGAEITVTGSAAWQAEILDVNGRHIHSLVSSRTVSPDGLLRFHWDGKTSQGNTAAAGIYVFSLRGPEGTFSKRMLAMR
jgi:hypothetical protein